MFNFPDWIAKFRRHYEETGGSYNDAEGVTIAHRENANWIVLGVHHLTGVENQGNHNVFIEVLCKQWERDGMRAVYWDWKDRQPDEQSPGPLFVSKPPHELADIALFSGMKVDVWIQGGDSVGSFYTGHLNNGPDSFGSKEGNSIGNHSFFVCFLERDRSIPIPGPPEPVPEPEPSDPEPIEKPVMTIDSEWLKKQPVKDGIIEIYGK